jgi:hypothetical protein
VATCGVETAGADWAGVVVAVLVVFVRRGDEVVESLLPRCVVEVPG